MAAIGDTAPPTVWYAAYGSNVAEHRLTAYLRGGSLPETGRRHRGSADPRPHGGSVAWRLDRQLVFAGWSRDWGGGVAYLGQRPGTTLGRAWRLSWRQFEDVLAQENGVACPHVTLADAAEGRVVVAGSYGRVRLLGWHAQAPVVTFTAPDAAGLQPAAPSEAYLRVILGGLAAAYPHLAAGELAEVLHAAVGVRPAWSREALCELARDAVRTPTERRQGA